MSQQELEVVFSKITQQFVFNMYIISDEIDVHVTFETMNNRGKPLSNLELLKNRMIYVATLLNIDENDQVRLRNAINNCWKKIYHILGKSKSERLLDDEFLVTHFMLYFAEEMDNIKKSRHELRDQFGEYQCNYLLNKYFVIKNISEGILTAENCFDYIDSLNRCIEFWGDIKVSYSSRYSNEIQDYIDKINLLANRRYYRRGIREWQSNISYLNVFLLACLQKSPKDTKLLTSFLKSLERYLFLLEFYCLRSYEVNIEHEVKLINMEDMVKKLNNNNVDINYVISKLNKISNYLCGSSYINTKISAYYSKKGFFENSWLRYYICHR